MKRLARLLFVALLALMLLSLLVACANPIGSRASTGANRPPAAAQPSKAAPIGNGLQSDPQADSLDQALTDLEYQLNSTDMLDDLK